MTLVLMLAGVVALFALAAAPLLLPWQHHVRWLIATNAGADRWVPGAGVDVGMEEVRVVQRIGNIVRLACEGATDRHTLSTPEIADSDCRWLDRSAIAGTPLVQVVHPDGVVSLHSRNRAIVGLRPTVELPDDPEIGDLIEQWLHQVGEVTR